LPMWLQRPFEKPPRKALCAELRLAAATYKGAVREYPC
jgi:hypothetical protein